MSGRGGWPIAARFISALTDIPFVGEHLPGKKADMMDPTLHLHMAIDHAERKWLDKLDGNR